MRYLFLPILCLFVLTGCTETQLVTHVAKKALPGTSKSEGDFKVGKPYKVAGKTYTPRETYNFTETGIASWYGPNFHGKKTANGETFDMNELTAAHRTLQIPSLVRVTNLENGRSLIVRVNDRGPFKRGRIIDLSKRAAELLDFTRQGTAKVRIQVLSEESRAIAEAAKRGEDTRGIEVAMNENRIARSQAAYRPTAVDKQPQQATPAQPIYAASRTATVQPVEQEVLVASDITGHVKDGNFLPDPIVKQMPISPSNIYVQAGSFGNKANAERLAGSLSSYGSSGVYPATVNGQQFYRVRLGPMLDVNTADIVLANLVNAGQNNAIIVVD